MIDRVTVLKKVRRIILKIGTAALSTPEGRLDADRVAALAEQVNSLVCSGYEVVIVTSGAIGAGMAELELLKRPTALPQLQAAASVGQSHLIETYNRSFRKHGHHAAQVLLTREDFNNRNRYLNVRNAINAMFAMDAIPVINENDAVSVDEIKFGDNDQLSALVALLLCADLLILLSVVDGLLDSRQQVISTVERVDGTIRAFDRGTKTAGGTGGMTTKLEAASLATSAGIATIVANGVSENILTQIIQGKNVGTFFAPNTRKAPSRKCWFASRIARGTITVDEGARRALVAQGKSLLPSGIISVTGNFEKGDTVKIAGPDGCVFAHGLTNMSSVDLTAVSGMKSQNVRKVLGPTAYDEAVHRDNLLLQEK